MNTANRLTMLRVAMIPLFLLAFCLDFPFHRTVALGIFILASLTDFADGYIARHRNQITNFGKFMDPLADKLLVISAMLCFVVSGRMPFWVLLIVLAREFAVSGLRMLAAEQGVVIAAALSGKVKTFSTMVCICVMLIPPLADVGFSALTLNNVCVAVIAVTTVWSGAEYFIRNRSVFAGSV